MKRNGWRQGRARESALLPCLSAHLGRRAAGISLVQSEVLEQTDGARAFVISDKWERKDGAQMLAACKG